MPRPRFSKASVAEFITNRVREIQKVRHFDPDNGWAQVEGRDRATNRDYGEFRALLDLAQEFELPPLDLG